MIKAGCGLALTAWLAGCGGEDVAKVETTYYRLKEITRLTLNPGSGIVEQSARLTFSYKGTSDPDRVVFYNGKGADSAWGGTDDMVGYYVVCAYSGKAKAEVLDLESEIRAGLHALYTAFPAAVAAVRQDDAARACAVNYNKQGRLDMKVYSGPGTNGVWLDADDTLLYTVTWQQPVTVADASVQVAAPGVAGFAGSTLVHYYYGSGGGAVIDLVRTGLYARYNVDTANRLTRLTNVSHTSAPETWPGPQFDDIRLDYTEYEYLTSAVRKCTRNNAGTPLRLSRDTYADGFLQQRQTLNTGIDAVACSADDLVSATDAHLYESL